MVVELQDWHEWWNASGSNELREILLKDWDPLLVGDAPQAQDEYDGYAGPLGSLLRRGGGQQAVVEYLVDCERGMGFKPSAEPLNSVAEEIVSWYGSAMADKGAET